MKNLQKKIYVGGGGIFSTAAHVKERSTINISSVNCASCELRSWEVHCYKIVYQDQQSSCCVNFIDCNFAESYIPHFSSYLLNKTSNIE